MVLLSLLSSSFEPLVTALLMGKNTIKIDEVTFALFQNKILRRENRASSLGNDLALAMIGGGGGRGRSGKESQDGQSRSKSRDSSKIRCYQYDKLGHRVGDGLQLKDRMKTTVTVVHDSNTNETNDMLMVSDKVSTVFS